MIFLLVFLAADTLRFTNPRLITDSLSNFVAVENLHDTNSKAFSFEGSKGIFLVFQGLTLDFSQSLDLKIQGNLSESLVLSARLKDNSTYYGNDYYSKSLGEVDEIHLSVEEQNGVALNLGKFLFEGRKLLGFFGSYRNFHVVYGSTEQMRQRKVIEYKDFYNGPYFVDYGYLIVPGSVQLFLNGFLVEKEKYSFDYSSGALYLNELKVLPGDILHVEYSVYSFAPSIFTSVRGKFGRVIVGVQRLSYSKGVYDGFPPELLEYIRENGDSCSLEPYHGGIKTGKGDYTLQDTVFVFVGQGRGEYQVYFKFAGEGRGSYVFDNLLGGYKFVGQGKGLYEPEVSIVPPVDLFLTEISYDGFLQFNGRLSYRDMNTLSSKNDGDNLGYEFELGRNFNTSFINLRIRWRNRCSNFSTIDGEVDPFWSVNGRKFSNQLDLFVDSKKVGTSLKTSLRVVEGKQIYSASFENHWGPFFAKGILSQDDSLAYKLLSGFDFEKLPPFNVLLSKAGSLRAFLSDSIENLEYLLGASFDRKDKKIRLFIKSGFKQFIDEHQVSADFFYFPEYQASVLYKLYGATRVADGLTISGTFSFVPVLLPLHEERYYRVPEGMFSYDERTGIFVQDVNGNYDRELVYLGVFDTTLWKSYSLGVNFDHFVKGFLQYEKASSLQSNNWTLNANLRKNELELNLQKFAKHFSNVLNARKTENFEIGVKFPVLRLWFLNFKFKDYLEEPIQYSIWSGYLVFVREFLNLVLGVDYTYFNSLTFPAFHMEGGVLKRSEKVKLIVSFYVNYPFNSPNTLPMAIPTSKRYGFSLSLKKPYRMGEFFVDGLYSKSLVKTSKVRLGYNFLF